MWQSVHRAEINRVGIAILCQKSGLSLTILQQEPGFCKSEHVSLAETRTTCWLALEGKLHVFVLHIFEF